MRSDEGRGTPVDLRARRAARALQLAVTQLEPHDADLERFERFRRRRRRNERYRVIAVAAVVSVLAALVVTRVMASRFGEPATPVLPRGNGLIVFGRSAPGLDQRSLFTIVPDGSNERRLPVTYTDCGEWSPDGSRLHVTAHEYPGSPLRPAMVDPQGGGFTILDTSAPADLNLGCGDWSPDGTRLVLEGFARSAAASGIYTVDASDGANLVRLTRGQDYVPQFSPDGSAIVFQRTAHQGSHAGAAALFVIGADGAELRRITPWGVAASSGSWSPDGRIVFAGPRHALWTVDPDGTGLARITGGFGGRPEQPRWSPDGREIVFVLQIRDRTDIYTVRQDGSDLTQVTATPAADEWWPDWNMGDFPS